VKCLLYQLNVSHRVYLLYVTQTLLRKGHTCLPPTQPAKVETAYCKVIWDAKAMVYRDKRIGWNLFHNTVSLNLFEYFLYQNILIVSVKVYQSQVKDGNLMNIILSKLITAEILDSPYILTEYL
jgi:lysophospholipid acyltransferase (LPLAT)-like uncharacterized protein